MEKDICFFYVPFGSEESAKKAGESLLKKRLIACYNLFPISSGYWWEGNITKDNEWVLIAKTLISLEQKVREALRELHPYTIPCIATFHVRVNSEYFEWLKNEVQT